VPLLLISVAMFAVGGSILDASPVFGWLCIVLFAFIGLLSAVLVLRPQTLRLDAQGFTISGGPLLKPATTLWRDVTEFFVFNMPSGGTLPGYNFQPHYTRNARLRRINSKLGAESTVAGRWKISTEELTAALENYRQRVEAHA